MNGNTASGVLSYAVESNAFNNNVSFYWSLNPGDRGPFWSRTQVGPTRDQIDSFHVLFEDARGWPLPALMALHSSDTTFAAWETNWGLGLGRASDQGQYGVPRALPLRPIIGGFLVDWTVFAVVSYLVLYRISHARHNFLLRRKRCAACGYPSGTSSVCTECGAGR